MLSRSSTLARKPKTATETEARRQPGLQDSSKLCSRMALYGVPSAVTRRACRIGTCAEDPATRRQDASKFGQACFEQSLPIARISSRSLLARTCGTLASTSGAKPGRSARPAATNAATAKAATALIMTSPVSWSLDGPRLVGHCHTKQAFPDVFAERKSGFIPSRFVSSPRQGRNKIAGRRAPAAPETI
jgi:hypothetical protein